MEPLIVQIRHSPMDAALHSALIDTLNKAGKKLTGSVDKVLNEYHILPSDHGLAYIELLHYKLVHLSPSDLKCDPCFVEQVRVAFLALPLAQLSLCTKSVAALSRALTKVLLSTGREMRGIAPIKAIIQKITALSPSTLTSVHADLMLLVLRCHAYDLVSDLPFLLPSSTLLSINPSLWPLEPVDYLQFWLYVGSHHAALKHFSAASEALMLALTIPTAGAVSAIQVAAYKKMILVSLLANGEVANINPRLVSPVTLRILEGLSQPYQEIVNIYRKSSSSSSSSSSSTSGSHLNSVVNELRQCVEQHSGLFSADRSLGLLNQLIRRLVATQISRLTQTYITFSLNDIAQQVNMDNLQVATATTTAAGGEKLSPQRVAERYVFDMICARDVFAKLDSRASMVRFLDDPEEYDTAPFIARMDEKISEIQMLSTRMEGVEREMALTPAFLIKSGAVSGGGGKGEGGKGAFDADLAFAMRSSQHEARGGGDDDEDDQMKRAMEASLMDRQ